jgi:hypothetical protein
MQGIFFIGVTMIKAEGTFAIVSWTENTTREQGSQKTTRATVEYKAEGSIRGRLFVEYVMFYSAFDPKDVHYGVAEFSGTIWFIGEVNGSEGSFGAIDRGVFKAGEVKSEFNIVGKSGTGNLKGIKGKGSFLAGSNGMKIDLSYDI